MNAVAPRFGCVAGGLPFEEALQRVLGLVDAPLAAEPVPLDAALGRILAEPVAARLGRTRLIDNLEFELPGGPG